jgi:hypothetical protein
MRKLRSVIRQLFHDKTELKDQLDTEVSSHRRASQKFSEEIRLLRSEISRLQCTERSALPSAAEDIRINQLLRDVDTMNSELQQASIKLQDSNQVIASLEKDVEELKSCLSGLEDRVQNSQVIRSEIANQQTILRNLEDSRSEASRRVSELEVLRKMRTLELDVLRQRERNQPDTGSCAIVQYEPIYIRSPIGDLKNEAVKCFCDVNDGKVNSTEDELVAFLKSIGRKMNFVQEENNRLRVIIHETEQGIEKLELNRCKSPASSKQKEVL